MPGKKITDHQVHKYKQHRNTLTQVEPQFKADSGSAAHKRKQRLIVALVRGP
jgi:hypothetical protein